MKLSIKLLLGTRISVFEEEKDEEAFFFRHEEAATSLIEGKFKLCNPSLEFGYKGGCTVSTVVILDWL